MIGKKYVLWVLLLVLGAGMASCGNSEELERLHRVNAGTGSQFFIMHGHNPGLDHQYTAFGHVTDGMDAVNAIATTETSRQYQDQPVEDVIINRIELYRE